MVVGADLNALFARITVFDDPTTISKLLRKYVLSLLFNSFVFISRCSTIVLSNLELLTTTLLALAWENYHELSSLGLSNYNTMDAPWYRTYRKQPNIKVSPNITASTLLQPTIFSNSNWLSQILQNCSNEDQNETTTKTGNNLDEIC
jgi:hypothetical protein